MRITGLQFEDNVSPEINNGIRDSIGRKNVVTLKKMVKLEKSHGDKADAKVLVLTPYRCQLLGVKAPFKLEHDFHFLDIKSLDSPTPQRLVISTNNGKIFFMQMIGTDDADHIIGRIALSLRSIFPTVALSRILKASLEPLGRQKLIQSMLNQADQLEPGPCCNFSEMYRCLCDHLNSPLREDVEWDVETIYLSQNCREINVKDFDLEVKDMVPIISVMMYNRWFDSLVMKDAKVNSDVLNCILQVARNSHNLKRLTITGVGLKSDFAQNLSMKLVDNKESCLEELNLSNNPLEDKGLLHLSGALPSIKHGGVRRLDFSITGLSPRGINGLCQSLRSSPKILESLTHLNLSGNWIRGDEAEELLNFLSDQNNITDLDISTTDCSVEVFIAALSTNCINTLKNLYIGRNHFYGRKSAVESILPPGFLQFFKKSKCLQKADLSNMKLPTEALRSMLDGLQDNDNPGLAVELNLANCELKSHGCYVLETKMSSMKNITKLNVSENGFDNDLVSLFDAMQANKSIKELNIGKNFSGIKTKSLKRTMEAIVECIQEENSRFESLSLADSKIREHIHTLLGCLGSNASLTALDISGNLMGDGGARVLAKSIQINSKLKIIKFDRNNLTAAGFEEISNAMEKNFTLRHIPYPVADAVAAMKSHPDRTQNALSRIQNMLLRNADENRGSNEQEFRLQSAVTSTAQKVLDKVAEKVDDAISALEILDADSCSSDSVVTAKNLVKDASNSRQLLCDIYGLAMEKAVGQSSPLQEKLIQVAANVEEMVQEHLKISTSAMMRNAEAQCPHMFEEIKEELKESIKPKRKLPADSIKSFILKSAGTEIVNKVSELNLTIATLISDKVTDSLLASLSQSNSLLNDQLKKCKDRPKSPSTLEEECDATGDEVDERVTNTFVERSATSDLLPVMRKERAQSVAKRRQRPDGLITTQVEKESKIPRVEKNLDAKEVEDTTDISEKGEAVNVKEEETTPVITEELPSSKKERQQSPQKEEHNESLRKSLPEQILPKPEDILPIPEDIPASDQTDKGMEISTPAENEFPEVAETKTLEHITKGRPRGPTRRQRKGPTRPARPKQEDSSVDGFFQNNVSNTDFSEVPTTEEEEEIKRKERIEAKMSSKKLPGMGAPLIMPNMLKLNKKPSEKPESSAENAADPESEEKTERVTSPVKSPRRPKGGMVVPGMGFGGNILAEMKLKKLSKKSQDNLDVKSPGHEKADPPFGVSMLKKRTEETTSKDENGNLNNNNNNNNNSKSSVPLKDRFLSKLKPNSDKDAKKDGGKSEAAAKVKPLVPPNKPAVSAKPKPPPLSNKPKPSLFKPGHGAKTRPVSELFENKKFAAASSPRTRSASVEKDENLGDKE